MERIEIENRFRIRKLNEDESIGLFDCGDEDLNDFILNDAIVYRIALLAVTYVLEDKTSGEIAAYFSLANDRVGLADFPDKTEFNRFRKHKFVNDKRLKSYPAAKICRLAISKDMRGKELGSYLMNFIKTLFFIDNKTGCRFLTVDAYSDAVEFYLRNDFSFLSGNDVDSRTRLLFFDLNDLQG